MSKQRVSKYSVQISKALNLWIPLGTSCRHNGQLITRVLTDPPRHAKQVADITVDLLINNMVKYIIKNPKNL